MNSEKVIPVNTEVHWDKSLELVSKTDKVGTIKYANEAFVNVCGYEEYELVGQAHNTIRHPEMPKVIFKLLWKNLLNGKDFHAIVKNMAKHGRYYWVITRFEIFKDDKGEITGFMGRRKSVPTEVSDKIEELYKKLKQIEDSSGIDSAEDYLTGYLEDQKKTYEEYISEILNSAEKDSKDTTPTKKSLFGRLFG